jgi:hypothetical protein
VFVRQTKNLLVLVEDLLKGHYALESKLIAKIVPVGSERIFFQLCKIFDISEKALIVVVN